MSDEQIKALQEELAALRNRAKRRTFGRVLKDAFKKLIRILDKEEEERTNQEFIVLMFFTMTAFALLFAFLMLSAVIVMITKGLIFLLIPAYVLYYLLKKD